MSIGELRRVIRDAGLLGDAGGEPTPSELADILWLAAILKPDRSAPLSGTEDDGLLVEPEAPSSGPPGPEEEVTPSPVEVPQRGGAPPRPLGLKPNAPFHLVLPSREPGGAGAAGNMVAVAMTPQLPDPLPLARAMRPLRRRVITSQPGVLDEEATADLRAEQRLWLPALLPATEPAFDLAIVIDDSESMALWSAKIRELRLLCEQLGGLRDVRTWYLVTGLNEGSGQPALRAAAPGSQARDPRELADPSGRRIILVVTDGVHPWWAPSGPLRPVLARWALAGPVAIVQPFPQRLWGRSILRPVAGQFRSGWPGSGPTIAGADSVTVPVLELTPRAVSRWASVISGGMGAVSLAAAILPRGADDAMPGVEPRVGEAPYPGSPPRGSVRPESAELDPEQLVRSFRAAVSPAAYRLAGYLSAAQLTLPVMRLVQETKMPGTGSAELAEVLLSGLLRRSPRTRPMADSDSIEYVFQAGVREILQSTLTRGEAISVLDQVGNYLLRNRRGGRSFSAALTIGPEANGGTGETEVEDAAREFPESFGRISGMLLGRLSGSFSDAALHPTVAKPNAPVPDDLMRGVIADTEPLVRGTEADIQVETTAADEQAAVSQPVIPEAHIPGPRASASRILRVLVTVDDAWTVTVTLPGVDEPSPYVRSMGRQLSSDGRAFPMPPATELPDQSAEHFAFCSGEQPEAVADAYHRIAEGQGSDVAETFGRYLFDCLIGPATWAAIGSVAAGNAATTVEIALSFAPSSHDLHRFTWEAMASADGFLAAGLGVAAIIITRLSGSLSLPRLVANRPVRILFVMGSDYTDPLVHPGVEHLELIRHHGPPGNPGFDWRLVSYASPQQITHVARSFRPDIVHIVSHAHHDPDGRSRLLLGDEEDGRSRMAVGAEQLLNYLWTDSYPPVAIVLSLCSAGRGAIGRAEGAGGTAEFATALVDYGVPVVAVTGGAIADTTSRLFTRQFATAIQQGLPVIPSLARAFRAAFTDAYPHTPPPIWPALFMSSGVPNAFSLRAKQAGPLEIETAIQNLRLTSVPIFCGRDSLIARFEEILEPGDPEVLLVYTRGATAGLGRTRLLHEFALKAIVRGNVPVLLQETDDRFLGDISQVGDALRHAIMRTRAAFRLGEDPNSQLTLLRRARTGTVEQPDPDNLTNFELTTEAIGHAMELDLTALAEDARRQHDNVRDAAGRVVVFIEFSLPANELALHELLSLLDRSGLGSTDQHVPVVIMMSIYRPTDTSVQRYITGSFSERWLRIVELKPFSQTDGEDMLVYEQVWLHPFRTFLPHQLVINHDDPAGASF